jgi:hypothetical protein
MKRRDKPPAPPSAPVLTLIPGGRTKGIDPFDAFVSATHASLSIWAVSLDFWAEYVRSVRDQAFAASKQFKGGAPS